MRHASFFSGVGGLDLGFERAGIKTVSVCEIEPYASSVLAERFPEAPNLGSITEINANDIPEADIWSGGFPCQDLSVAGKRAGFSGKRSSLAFTFLDLVEQRRPRWLVLENVPGLFTSNKGADFARLLNEMEQLGYGVSWRTLDARYFGVAQRRRRVFIVASLESDRAGEVLFECEGCERHPAPGKSSWQNAASLAPDGSGVAGALLSRYHNGVSSTIDNHLVVGSSPNADRMREVDGVARRVDDHTQLEDTKRVGNFELYDFPKDAVAPSMNARRAADLLAYQTRVDEKNNNFTLNQVDVANSISALWPADTSHRSMTLVAPGEEETVMSFPSRFGSNAQVTEGQAQSFAHSAGAPAVFRKSRRAQNEGDAETWVDDGLANTLNSFDVGDVRTTHAIIGTSYDGYNQKIEPDGAHRTLRIGRDSSDFIVARGEIGEDPLLPQGLDTHRYRCCGNGVVANVAEWIGHRLVAVEKEWNND
jgi:DNA-cytosine methyltransferase